MRPQAARAFVGAIALIALASLTGLPAEAAPLGTVPPDTAQAGYNPATGQVLVSATDVRAWLLTSPAMDSSGVVLPNPTGAFPMVGQQSVGESGGPLAYGDHDLGLVAVPGLAPSSLSVHYSRGLGMPQVNAAFDPLDAPSWPALPGEVRARYDPATGRISVSVNTVWTWYVESLGNMTGSVAQLPGISGTLNTDNDDRIGQATFQPGSVVSFADADLGPILPAGLTTANLSFYYLDSTFTRVQATVTTIPEPASLALLTLGAIIIYDCSARRRRKT